jgi:glycosyltransferase involved in cell wall biosynthesis
MTATKPPQAGRLASSAGGLRPVRVCFMIDELDTAGTETQLLALIRHLDRRRVLPYLCLLRGGARSRALEPDCCPLLRLNVGSLCRPATLAKAWHLAAFLRRERIDVLQPYFPDSTYLGTLVGRLAGVPHVVRTRNNLGYWLTPLHRGLGRICGRLADATVANCDAARAGLLAEGAAPARVVVLENGVDLDRFAALPPLHPDAGPVRVAAVANLRPVKGLDLLVRAAAEVVETHPQTTFEVAGEGESRPALERQIRELGLEGHCHLPGAVGDVPAFLGRAAVAVLPSRSEGMSHALLEYMAAGRAIVATNVGANARLVTDGIHGLIVPPGDAGALATALQRLIDDPALRCRLGAAAHERAHRDYGREAMVQRFEDFYERLVRGGLRCAG